MVARLLKLKGVLATLVLRSREDTDRHLSPLFTDQEEETSISRKKTKNRFFRSI